MVLQRVIVTGANGVIGRALVARLEQTGADVVTLGGRTDCNLEDPCSTNSFFEKAEPELVYHLAGAVFGVGGNTTFPGDAFRRNTLINTNVVEATRLAGAKKIVAMGSAAIYADGLPQPMQEVDALVGEPHGSEYAYAFSKRGMLVQLESYQRQYGLDYAYVISTNLYGPHDRFNSEYGHVIPSLLTKFERAQREGGEVIVWGDGTPTRDFLYSKDAAKGLMLLMKKGDGRYNLASGVSCSIRQMADSIAAFYPEVVHRYDVTKPLGQLSRSYEVKRLQSLGFTCEYTLEKGLAETVEWVRNNYSKLRV
ncbi:NAD-dependent epimerase/dehydratase family protein [Sphingomonas sp. PAMC 26617]|uniref:NAD-dependent epimerase/dehydratase family protein n=1 Tax=Sphingomonas sp. PAMC 26617 TaxID=1112216 RepID=UPI00049769FF|nr:NAD-dependent epimerase/dehydratase family protein [Sphingomonas sp. PAMC 26617]